MAKLVPFLGNISGKIAGNVFASGKGGAYIRQFVKPTNPKSSAQIRARQSFSAASRAFGALQAPTKSAFNLFAMESFSPKNPKAGVTYSGAGAYSSLFNQVLACNGATGNQQEVIATPSNIPCTNIPFTIPTSPPIGKFSGMISNTAQDVSAPINVTLAVCGVTPGSYVDINIDYTVGGIDPDTFGEPQILDVVSFEKFGFAVYVSKRIPSGTTKPAQIQKFCVAAFPAFTLTSPAVLPDVGVIELETTVNPNIAESKYQLISGDIADYEIYAISVSGCSALVGSGQITLA